MTENPYARWLKADFDLCLPVVDKDGLNAILGQVGVGVFRTMGLSPKPVTGAFIAAG